MYLIEEDMLDGLDVVSTESGHRNGGPWDVVHFKNGYGASVVSHSFSYGLELAVLESHEDGDVHLTYDTSVTSDVLGHLDDESLRAALVAIAALDARV